MINANELRIKWVMNTYTNFTGFIGGCVIHIRKSSLGWIWNIEKDDKQVDTCFHYRPAKSELSAKVMAEKYTRKFLSQLTGEELNITL